VTEQTSSYAGLTKLYSLCTNHMAIVKQENNLFELDAGGRKRRFSRHIKLMKHTTT